MIRADHDITGVKVPGAGEVLAYCASLDLSPGGRAAARRLLSRDEIARADAFHASRDGDRFAAARAWLRRMLGAALGRDAAGLRFRSGKHGKPALACGGVIDFNLAHAEGYALLALSPGFPVGVDIEIVRPFAEDVAGAFFSADEQAALRACPASDRATAFYRLWTRKEAYLKALGSGLATPLDAFSVSLTRDAALLEVRGSPEEAAAWRLAHLEPGPGLVAAVAARRPGWTLLYPAPERTR